MRLSPFLMAFILLAGCLDEPPADEPVETTSVITDPTDYSYLDQDEDGAGWHVHDYWRGEDNLTVLEGRSSCMSCVSTTSGGDGVVTMATFRPGDGQVVPQGAAWIHATATWSMDEAASTVEKVSLWVKTAADRDPRMVDFLSQGEALTFNVTNEQDDPPHMQLSAWRFELRGHGSGDETRIEDWQVTLDVVAERGHDIPPWPPHPDAWQGATELTLVDASNAAIASVETPTLVYCFGGCIGRTFQPMDGAIVPIDAAGVRVTVEHGAGVPIPLKLLYHGGDTWDLQEVQAEASTPTTATFDIPVVPPIADSPYAKQSIWELRVEATLERPYAWTGEYRVDAVAYR